MKDAIKKAAALVEALPYIRRFQGKEVVIKFGGSIMDRERVFEEVLVDAVFLATVGVRPIIVHGGGKHISRAMEGAGLEARFVEGHRVTDAPTLEIAVEVLTGQINARICGRIAAHGARGVPGFQDGRSVLEARRKTICTGTGEGARQVDLGFVGEVVRVDTARLRALEAQGDIVAVPPVAQDEAGQLYNVNADSAAAALACELRAEKIVFLSDVHGIMERPGEPDSFLSTVDEARVEELIAEGVIRGGMLPKVAACIRAIHAGVHKAHIIDAGLDHALLLEIFTDEGVGTQIVHGEGP